MDERDPEAVDRGDVWVSCKCPRGVKFHNDDCPTRPGEIQQGWALRAVAPEQVEHLRQGIRDALSLAQRGIPSVPPTDAFDTAQEFIERMREETHA